jgi:predicted pyridoxine 5'-phosphate oxidase superfamily flavin-nucleotide-binding protein
MVVDRERADGYQVKGTAQLLTSGDFFERVAKRQEERGRPRPRHVAKIRVEEIYPVKPDKKECLCAQRSRGGQISKPILDLILMGITQEITIYAE